MDSLLLGVNQKRHQMNLRKMWGEAIIPIATGEKQVVKNKLFGFYILCAKRLAPKETMEAADLLIGHEHFAHEVQESLQP